MDRRAVGALLIANVLGGACYAGMKLALEGMPAFWVVGLRVGITLLGTAILMGRSAFRWEYRGKDLGLLLLVGVLGFALPIALIVPGLRHAPSVNASVLILLEPIGIVGLSFLFLKERTTGRQALGIALGLGGAALVVLGSGRAAGGGSLEGNLILAIQGLLWSVWTVAGKPLLKRHSPMSMTYASSVVALAALLGKVRLVGRKAGQDLQPGRDPQASRVRKDAHGMEAAVDPELDLQPRRPRDQVEVAGGLFGGLPEEFLHQGNRFSRPIRHPERVTGEERPTQQAGV